MKLAFELIIIPPVLYHCGEGSVKRETVVVDIPDDLIPERIRKGMEKKQTLIENMSQRLLM